MSYESIFQELALKKYRSVYWLEGEEDYFIDRISKYLEDRILTEAEKDFNLTVIYGKDASWAGVINACRRYPVFSERQVVILKEAQSMNELDRLAPYLEYPLPSTILVICFKHGKLDGRSKIGRMVRDQAEYFYSKRLNERQIPAWIESRMKELGYPITPKAVMLLADHIGQDLSRLNQELEKILVNKQAHQAIDEQDIEQFTGISKEFNVFELQDAIGKKDLVRAMRIVRYFEDNPKAGPLPVVLVSLYHFFAKVSLAATLPRKNDQELAGLIGVSPFFVRDYLQAASRYGSAGAERNILLLAEYNLRSIGIGSTAEPGDLMKELVCRMIY